MSLNSRNDELNERLDATDLPKAVYVLVKDAHKRKRQMKLLAISIALDLILTGGLAALSFKTHSLAKQAESNRTAIIRNCETSNDARSKNNELWQFAFNLPETTKPTPQQQDNIDKFKAKVDDTFMLRDCNKALEEK